MKRGVNASDSMRMGGPLSIMTAAELEPATSSLLIQPPNGFVNMTRAARTGEARFKLRKDAAYGPLPSLAWSLTWPFARTPGSVLGPLDVGGVFGRDHDTGAGHD